MKTQCDSCLTCLVTLFVTLVFVRGTEVTRVETGGEKKVLILSTTIAEYAPSHLRYSAEIANALHDGGFNVTFLLPEPAEPQLLKSGSRATAAVYFPVDASLMADLAQQVEVRREACRLGHGMKSLVYVHELDVRRCDAILSDHALLGRLRGEGFDFAMTEAFPGACSMLIADAIGLPFAAYSPSILPFGEPLMYAYELNYPNPLSTIPLMDMPLGMTFLERVQNVFYYLNILYANERVFNPPHAALKVKHGINPHETLRQLYRKTEMVFTNSFLGFQEPRATPPNYHLVGGLSAYPPSQALPGDVAAFIDSAGEVGVVYLTFGARITDAWDDEYSEGVFAALGALDQKVIAPWNGPVSSAVAENTRVWKWLPQNDILADPRVKIVISHCGVNSLMEAIHHNKLIVCIVFWGDSLIVAPRCESAGVCRLIPLSELTPAVLRAAVADVSTDPSYRHSVVKVSVVMNDRPLNGAETIRFWVGHWFRNNGSEFTKIVAPNNLNVFQYFLIDILSLFVVVSALLSYTTYKIMKSIFSKVSRRNSKPKSKTN